MISKSKAHCVALCPSQFVFPALFTSVTYYMTGQVDDIWRFSAFTAVSIAIALISQSQGLLIGAIFMEDASAAVFLGPISCIPLLLFAGFFVRIATIPTYFKPMTYISYLRYGFEALIAVIYGHNRCQFDHTLANETSTEKPEWLDYLNLILKPPKTIDSNDTEVESENFIETLLKNIGGQFSTSADGSDYQSMVMSQFELTDESLYINILWLLFFFFLLRFLTYLILLKKVNKHE